MTDLSPDSFELPAAPRAGSFARLVVHLGGYDPMAPEVYHRRFQRELTRFHSTWAIATDVSPLAVGEGMARWRVAAQGTGWSSHSSHIMLRWDDVIESDRVRGWGSRLVRGVGSFVDFVWNGALYGYLRHAWRYAGFFLYPFVLLSLLGALAVVAAYTATAFSGLGLPFLVPLLAALLFALLLRWLGSRLFLDHLVDDWIYASQLLGRGDSIVSARLEQLAQELARHAGEGELLVVGHSLGAVHAVELIARLVELAPKGPPIRFASVGSSILKMGLNRRSRRLRTGMEQIAASPRVVWCEFHALNDVMNFYKCEPMAVLGLRGKPAMTRVVRFRAMLEPAYYRRMERNFFRLHCQFVSGNDRRAAYDYFMMLLGPFPMEALALSPEGPLPWIDATGGLTPDASGHLSSAR